jgi:hypothetical protein
VEGGGKDEGASVRSTTSDSPLHKGSRRNRNNHQRPKAELRSEHVGTPQRVQQLNRAGTTIGGRGGDVGIPATWVGQSGFEEEVGRREVGAEQI